MNAMKPIPERRRGFGFSMDISLGNILTIISMASIAFLSYGKLDSRIAVLESNENIREKALSIEMAAQTQQRSEVRQDLREIRNRLDALKDAIGYKK